MKALWKAVRLLLGLFIFSGFCGFVYITLDEYAETKALCGDWENHLIARAKSAYVVRHIEVEPWYGRHRVFGIFEVPVGKSPEGVLRVSLPLLGSVCGGVTEVEFSQRSIKGVVPKSGSYLVKANLRSRVAFWVVMQGQLRVLQDANAWVLY